MFTIRITGEMSLTTGKELLDKIWTDRDYLASAAALYDVDRLKLPDLNAMLQLCRYIAKTKQGRGPKVIAFVASAFGERGMQNVFSGFAPMVGLKLNFAENNENAARWLAEQTRQSP